MVVHTRQHANEPIKLASETADEHYSDPHLDPIISEITQNLTTIQESMKRQEEINDRTTLSFRQLEHNAQAMEQNFNTKFDGLHNALLTITNELQNMRANQGSGGSSTNTNPANTNNQSQPHQEPILPTPHNSQIPRTFPNPSRTSLNFQSTTFQNPLAPQRNSATNHSKLNMSLHNSARSGRYTLSRNHQEQLETFLDGLKGKVRYNVLASKPVDLKEAMSLAKLFESNITTNYLNQSRKYGEEFQKFLDGLEERVRCDVVASQPVDLREAVSLAKLFEAKWISTKQNVKMIANNNASQAISPTAGTYPNLLLAYSSDYQSESINSEPSDVKPFLGSDQFSFKSFQALNHDPCKFLPCNNTSPPYTRDTKSGETLMKNGHIAETTVTGLDSAIELQSQMVENQFDSSKLRVVEEIDCNTSIVEKQEIDHDISMMDIDEDTNHKVVAKSTDSIVKDLSDLCSLREARNTARFERNGFQQIHDDLKFVNEKADLLIPFKWFVCLNKCYNVDIILIFDPGGGMFNERCHCLNLGDKVVFEGVGNVRFSKSKYCLKNSSVDNGDLSCICCHVCSRLPAEEIGRIQIII